MPTAPTQLMTETADINALDFIHLVQEVQRGQRSSFEELYRKTRPSLWSLVRSLMNDDQAGEDVLQETYVIVWTKIRVLRDPSTFWGWVRRLAVNLCLRRRSQLKKKGWTRLADPQTSAARAPSRDPIEHVPDMLDLKAGLERLPETDRALLILRELHGCSYEEIADILEMALGTVRSRLHSSRKKILKELQQKGPAQ